MAVFQMRAALLASACLISAPAIAQEATVPADTAVGATASESGLQDIVVTAQKRATNLQDTALAITAVGGNDLRSRQIDSVEALAPSLPNVNFGKNVGFARIAIRGVGLDTTVAGQEGRVAYHSDGIYISRPSAAIATFFDVDRIEVVRGPQGTLYGRNATAGAINVVTNDPEQTTSGYARLTVGNYGLVQSEGAITGAVSDTLSARFAYQGVNRGGYGRNLNLGEDIDNERSFGVRAKLKYTPSSTFDIVVSADYSHENDQAFVYHYLGAGKPNFVPFGQRLGGTIPDNPRDSFADTPQVNFRRFYGVGATATLDLGSATLTSVTGYRNSFTDYDSDLDGTQVNITNFRIVEAANQISQELRLNGKIGGLNYLIGGYYFHEKIYGNVAFVPLRQLSNRPVFAQGVDYRGNLDTKAYAVFGQLDYEIVPGLTASAGARYSYEKKFIDHRGVVDTVTPYDPNVPFNYTMFQRDTTSFDSVTPRFGLEFKPSDDVLVYLTYSKGFKSGGFSLNAFAPPLAPERLTDYEGGIKAEFLDGKLRTNFAAFYYDYTNLQVQRILGAVAIPVNAASARVKGVEVEITARPIPALELSFNGAYLDAKFLDFSTADSARAELGILNLAGNRLSQAPKFTGNAAIAYTIDSDVGAFTLRGEANYTDDVFFSFYNRPEVAQASYTKFNAFLNFKSATSGLNASLFMRNIGNKRTTSSAQVSAGFGGFPIVGAYDPPRTYGATVGISF